jgi:NADH-quinone oxidoreductase subunit G
LYGIEPEFDLADGAAIVALSKAQRVVAFAAFDSPALRSFAHMMLPIGLLPEIDATLTNVDGRRQSVVPGAKLPGEARAGWRVLRALGSAAGVDGFSFMDINAVRAISPPSRTAREASIAQRKPDSTGLSRISTTAIYRSDAVVRRSGPLNAHPLNRAASVEIHPDDAHTLELGEGDIARVDDGQGVATLPVRVSSRVARGAAWIETGHVATSALAGTGARVKVTKV